MTEPSISVSRDIAAPIERIFAVLARPHTHPEIDGRGMVRAALKDAMITKVGDVFVMDMFNDEMGEYVMENRVVEFEPDRRVVWEPLMRSIVNPEYQSGIGDSAFQRWGWSLEVLDTGHTRVTEFFDCSRSPDWLKKAVKNGERWRPAIVDSLDNLERMVVET